jgi:rRNA-processing protein EBP2
MVTKSKLKMALMAEKGVDIKKIRQKKLVKKARKQKSKVSVDGWEDMDEESEDDEAGGVELEHEEDDNASEEDRPAQVGCIN